jgi:rubrerythrin
MGKVLSTEEKLLEFINRQILVERQIVESLNKGLSNVNNPAVKGVLKSIALDSIKHEGLYQSALTLLTKVSTALKQENLDEQRALVEKHIALESELIVKLEQILPSIENKKAALLLNAILSDEKRHHELLKMVLEIIVRGETITEDDWWKLLWEDVPFHGAPGGG